MSAKSNDDKTPAFYTEKEGGKWISWTAGKVSKQDMKEAAIGRFQLSNGQFYITLNKVTLHSLLFPTLDPYKFVRFDAINGMTGLYASMDNRDAGSKWKVVG